MISGWLEQTSFKVQFMEIKSSDTLYFVNKQVWEIINFSNLSKWSFVLFVSLHSGKIAQCRASTKVLQCYSQLMYSRLEYHYASSRKSLSICIVFVPETMSIKYYNELITNITHNRGWYQIYIKSYIKISETKHHMTCMCLVIIIVKIKYAFINTM